MTQRLFYQDSHLTECNATVESCIQTDAGYDIVLDQTVLFENAGGQPCDTGHIGDAVVIGCDENEGIIYHHTDRPVCPGSVVQVKLDWPRRFDFMQQHTGEHLLSYAAYHLFGACNVGFHLSTEYTTIDLDKMLSEDELNQVEALANNFVFQNLPVKTYLFDTVEDLEKSGIKLRKQAEGLTAPIRIVEIENADCCTCCAPHCSSSGEIGLIYITDAIAYKGGIRITFLCGKRAVERIQQSRTVLEGISRKFSTSWESVTDSVSKMQEECKILHRRERELAESLNQYYAADLSSRSEKIGQTTLVLSKVENISPDKLKSLAQKTLTGQRCLTILFSLSADKLNYVLACSDDTKIDLSELCKSVNVLFSGKGGGRGTFAQGMSQRTVGIDESISQLHSYLTQILNH